MKNIMISIFDYILIDLFWNNQLLLPYMKNILIFFELIRKTYISILVYNEAPQ